MTTPLRLVPLLLILLALAPALRAQDLSPLRAYHVWLPMTGYTERDLDDAGAAGYDTVMLKIHPALAEGGGVDFESTDKQIEQINAKGMNVLLAILGWVGLGDGRFRDVDENGARIPNRLDPFWPEAMAQVERYYVAVIDHYKPNPKVVGFAPTWGIYGEAGFTSQQAGRSPHALARFNEWREQQGLPALDALPTRKSGPNTEFNRFIHFRFLYIERQFDDIVRRLKERAGDIPVGMWQEMYPVVGYLWNMVENPSADFGLYESGITFQQTHHPEKSLGETMGFRYKCSSARDYRDYYLPLLARRRGEGGRFAGCQLTDDYAVKNYGWTQEKAQEAGFERWEDEFGPVLKKLLDEPLETPKRDVLLVYPTYAAAALSDSPVHFADAAIIDALLRSFGCQMLRCGSPQLDKMSLSDMNRFRLIVIPDAAYLMRDTWDKLKITTATVLFTGCFAQALDGEQAAFGETRELEGLTARYFERPAGEVWVAIDTPITAGLRTALAKRTVRLPKDEASTSVGALRGVQVLLNCGEEPLIAAADSGRLIFISGHLFAGACYNPDRKPPADLAGSKDASANEVDVWGPYDSGDPQNSFTLALMKNILDKARVDYRVPDPKPRTAAPYLGDHMEQASISANLVYNNTAEPQTLTVRTPYAPKGCESRLVRGRYETQVTVPAFSYIALQPGDPE